MRILFDTKRKQAASTVLNLQKLEQLNEVEGVQLNKYSEDYADYDIILMMGYDYDIDKVRAVNKHALVGIVDPRNFDNDDLAGADFILANGIESEDYYYRFCKNIFKYYIYPKTSDIIKKHEDNDKIIIAYHGNHIHLEEMAPRILSALEDIGKEFKIELLAIYNLEKTGAVSWKPKNFKIEYKQWYENVYDECLSKADIGIIPNFIPIKNEKSVKKKIASFFKQYNESEADYLLRFKTTTNAGRIFPFMKYGIPVISDMFPSAVDVLDNEKNGFVAYSTFAWYHKLKKLVSDSSLREKVGSQAHDDFYNKYSEKIINQCLVDFLKSLLKN